jgi:hypothetical protein
MNMVTIKVIDESSGKPVKNKKVALGMPNGVTHGEWTNSEGEAYFDVKPNHGKVFVAGSKEYEGHLSGRVIVYI